MRRNIILKSFHNLLKQPTAIGEPLRILHVRNCQFQCLSLNVIYFLFCCDKMRLYELSKSLHPI